MGVLRGFAIAIVSVLLFVALIVGGVFSTLNNSLEYENVQPKTYEIANQIITTQIGAQQIVSQLTPFLEIYCLNNSEVTQKIGEYTLTIPCSIISEGYEEILNYSIDYFVKDFYYKEYNCTFTKCFEQSDTPLFLVSDYSKNHWKLLFYKSLIIIMALSILLLLLAERKSNGLILIGSLMIASSLIILQLEGIGTKIANAILSPISLAITQEGTSEILPEIVSIFFSESSRVFIWMFVAGLILIGLGIFFKITGWGMKIRAKIENMRTKNKVEELEEKTKNLEERISQKNRNSNIKNAKKN